MQKEKTGDGGRRGETGEEEQRETFCPNISHPSDEQMDVWAAVDPQHKQEAQRVSLKYVGLLSSLSCELTEENIVPAPLYTVCSTQITNLQKSSVTTQTLRR